MHVIAKALQTFDQSPSGVFRLQSITKVGSSVAVGFLPLDHVVGHDQDRMGHREHRTLLATARGEPPILRTQMGPTTIGDHFALLAVLGVNLPEWRATVDQHTTIPSKELVPHVPPNDVNVFPNYTGKLDFQRLVSFDPKVQSAIMRLHLRREYVSLDHIIDEIKDWSVIEQLFYLEFVYQQQGGYIDRAISCEPQ